MLSQKILGLFCGRKQGKTVGLVGDSGIGKTRKLRKIRGVFQTSICPTKNYEESIIDTEKGPLTILDISGDIETIEDAKSLVSRCEILFGVSGSSPELLNFWREACRDTGCFFEIISLKNLEQRLEKI
ncbi:P-loop kinase [Marseillevirus Shanghai 1]|nr:P-loop kinase [Marseillevirus Shanghai 1]